MTTATAPAPAWGTPDLTDIRDGWTRHDAEFGPNVTLTRADHDGDLVIGVGPNFDRFTIDEADELADSLKAAVKAARSA